MIDDSLKTKPFNKVCLGGTFDHLHQGHKELLKMAFKMGIHVSIGLTKDSLLINKKYSEKIQTYEKRKKNLEFFIEKCLRQTFDFYTIIPLNDPLGPVISETDIEAIVCSHETYRGCIKINEIRFKLGLTPLVIIIIPLFLNKLGKKLSSTDIRAELLQIEVDYVERGEIINEK
jgi:pantetheine-phosphate adenylyltransferase